MRVLAGLAIAGLLMSGCAAPGPLDEAPGPQGFVADYDVVVSDLDGEQTSLAGILRLALSGPETIADRDLVLRPAYRLETRIALAEGGAHQERVAERNPIVHWLDGNLLTVRTDCHGPVDTYDCTIGQAIDWRAQGSPPPYGYGWPDQLRYQVDGAWTETQTGTNPRRLPDGALLPTTPEQDAQLRFTPGQGGVPTSFVRRLSGMEGLLEGSLRSVSWKETLPVIEAWPMPPRGDVGTEDGRFLAGETDEAFGMGLSFLEAYEGLLARSADAAEAVETACALHALVFHGGGNRWTVPGMGQLVGEGDEIAFQLHARSADSTQSFEIRYRHDGGVLMGVVNNVTGVDPFDAVEDNGEGAASLRCPLRPTRPVLTPTDALHTAWSLGLSGIPCEIMTRSITFDESGQENSIAAGETVEFSISPPITNIGWDHSIGWEPIKTGYVAYNVEDGRLAWMAPWSQDDRDALDAGTLQPRPLPVEREDTLETGAYRCVPPVYQEFP